MKRIVALSFALLVLLAAVGAQEPDSNQLDISVSPEIIGATAGANFSLQPRSVGGVETSIIGAMGGSYSLVGYYRYPTGRQYGVGFLVPEDLNQTDPLSPPDGVDPQSSEYPGDGDYTGVRRWELDWELGIQQGILPRDDENTDKAVVFAFYRGSFNLPYTFSEQFYDAIWFMQRPLTDYQLLANSGLPEAQGSLLGSVHAGLAYSDVVTGEDLYTRSGLRGEFLMEWGPPFLHNTVLGEADYTRLALSGRAYLPIREPYTEDGRHGFATYFAGFAALDWATGPVVPSAVRSSFGVRSLRPGLGGSLRGIETGRFDATLKAILNGEIRVNLPGIPVVFPELWAIAFTDFGWYNDLEQLSPLPEEHTGTIVSSGIGLYASVFDFVPLTFYVNHLWNVGENPARVDGSRWQPFAIGFGFHF